MAGGFEWIQLEVLVWMSPITCEGLSKSSPESESRQDVRLAVGRLMDYRRHISPAPQCCTVLLPSNPGEDLTDFVHSVVMDLVFQDGGRFVRRPAPSRSQQPPLWNPKGFLLPPTRRPEGQPAPAIGAGAVAELRILTAY
jgi:hypothetical protein